MNTGKNYLDQGQAVKALEVYQKAVKLAPADADVHLNLANAYLLAGEATNAVKEADEVLKLDSNSAAAYFVRGSAYIRLSAFQEAVKALQTARNLDPSEPAVGYQLGVAEAKLNNWDEAIKALSEVVMLQPDHPAAHYQLSQALQRAGRDAEAQQELEVHQKIAAQNAGQTITPEKLEKSKFTQARVPFVLEQPQKTGIAVHFSDQTAAAFGGNAAKYSGPIAILDPNHTGTNSLFVLEPGQGFRLLWNSNAVFQPADEAYSAIVDAKYTKMLVGDLNSDRFEDIIVLGNQGAHIFKFATNGFAMDVGPFSRLQSLSATDGALADLDFTGKLDLLAVTSGTNDLRLYRQFGPLLFSDITSTSGIPANLTNAATVVIDDWPKDEMMDVIAGRKNEAPLLLAKPRGAPLTPTNIAGWPRGSVIATGDLNNDLRTDLVVANGDKIQITFQGTGEKKEIAADDPNVHQIVLVDYDNDGWLDIWAIGDRVNAWRNAGNAGFENVTVSLGLNAVTGPFSELHFADFDVDGDSDAVLTLANGGLKYLRNDGGDANQQLRLRLLGNRSNASGLGTKIEVTSGGLRLVRTVQALPIEIGVGKSTNVESLVVNWFNLAQPNVDVPVDAKVELPIFELVLPEGSCPYMYAWDGKQFRFVTDILGAAPAGLPAAEGVIIESDPDEYTFVGTEETFAPKDGYYTVQITEELREVLYLDGARLAVVDHPLGTEVHPTDKLVPGKPFPPSGLLTLGNEHPLRKAENLAGRDVTELLRKVDEKRVGPEKLRIPQLRGLAEPHGVILDFGELATKRPLVLAMNGWLRFGGGMANINGSQDPALPFPFPTLQAEVDGKWTPVNVVVGAPAGKTKTIVVDLAGKLPPGARRLKLETAFEIYWDRIALLEREEGAQTRLVELSPTITDLHWRGFSEFKDLPADYPLTPEYKQVSPNPKWRITPAGWCTRYGEVGELLARRDEGFVIMNGGDELTLKFSADELPPKLAGAVREFFIHTDGWDKDSDFHVRAGTTIEPLPWHGMNDQLYGSEKRPAFPSDQLHKKYNTRWVAPQTLHRIAATEIKRER
ncbi:MAG TPA: tetratricopeptide repeat protein [Verrucomicrobiae bacterium]|nr:tetratricopeptide repeat protein [Verrucomicrobiae bacterium]